MAHFSSWAVAAAILVEEDRQLHYTTLTKRILATGVTALGQDGETPDQTLGVVLRTKETNGRRVFQGMGGGYYCLVDRD